MRWPDCGRKEKGEGGERLLQSRGSMELLLLQKLVGACIMGPKCKSPRNSLLRKLK